MNKVNASQEVKIKGICATASELGASFSTSSGNDASGSADAGANDSWPREFDTAGQTVSEQLKFRRVSLPFKVTCVAAIHNGDGGSRRYAFAGGRCRR